MNDAVIQLNNLVKRFAGMDKPAVAPLNCTIQKGYVTGLVGPDGAGKTTLMRMLAGLLKPDEGTASVLGLDPIEDDGALHAMLGYMPQKFGLYEDLTVMENLNQRFGADNHARRFHVIFSLQGQRLERFLP